MKTSLKIAATGLLLAIIAVTAAFANDNETNRPGASTSWVAPASKTFTVRSMQDNRGDLLVWVNNTVKQAMTLRLTDLRGNEMTWMALGNRPQAHAIRLDLSEVPDGTYRLEVMSGTEKIVKNVAINTPAAPSRQAEIAVVQ